jgi:hypothetical protein
MKLKETAMGNKKYAFVGTASVLFVFLFLPVSQINAAISYTNFEEGPQVLSGGPRGSSDDILREKLEMKIIKSTNGVDSWLGFYTGHFGGQQDSTIHAVTSKDGITLSTLGQVINRGSQDQDPSFLVHNDTIYLYVETNDDHIDLFSSPASGALSFTFIRTVKANAASPVVWKEGSTWYLLYEYMISNPLAIHLATSTDGITWTDNPANPVKVQNGLETVPDSIIKDASGVYHMYYHYKKARGVYPSMHAASTDLAHWGTGVQVLSDEWNSPAAVLTPSGELRMYAWKLGGDSNMYLFRSVAASSKPSLQAKWKLNETSGRITAKQLRCSADD